MKQAYNGHSFGIQSACKLYIAQSCAKSRAKSGSFRAKTSSDESQPSNRSSIAVKRNSHRNKKLNRSNKRSPFPKPTQPTAHPLPTITLPLSNKPKMCKLGTCDNCRTLTPLLTLSISFPIFTQAHPNLT